jgi:hypothetical protein
MRSGFGGYFGGFLEEKWLDFDGFHGGNCGWKYLYYVDYLPFMGIITLRIFQIPVLPVVF